MGEKRTIIIVGAGYDALYAASSARLANERARIVVVADGDCQMLEHDKDQLLKSQHSERNIALDDTFRKKYSLEILRPAQAHSLDVDAQTVGIKYLDCHERYSYDTLIFAPQGKRASIEALPCLPGIRGFSTEQDIFAVRQAFDQGARTAVVLGLSPQGIHACCVLTSLGMNVIALDEKSRIMPEFSWVRSHEILQSIRKLPVDIKLNLKIVNVLETDAKSLKITLSNGESIYSDRIFDCRSLMPDVDLLADAGALLDGSSLIVVNEHLHTTLPNIFACGLSVAAFRSVSHEKSFMPYEMVREHLAFVAGKNAALPTKIQEKVRPLCGTLRILIHDRIFVRSGMSEHEARDFFGDEGYFSLSVAHPSLDVGMKVLLKKPLNTIIGAELYGHEIIDTLAPAISLSIQHGLSLEDMRGVEYSHSALQKLIDDAALSAHGATVEDLPLVQLEGLALWIAHHKDFSMINIDDEPTSWGALANKAFHIPLEELPKRMDDLAQYPHPLVLYSRSNSARYLAHKMLASYGVGQVFQLDGAGHDKAFLLPPKEREFSL